MSHKSKYSPFYDFLHQTNGQIIVNCKNCSYAPILKSAAASKTALRTHLQIKHAQHYQILVKNENKDVETKSKAVAKSHQQQSLKRIFSTVTTENGDPTPSKKTFKPLEEVDESQPKIDKVLSKKFIIYEVFTRFI